MYDCCSVSRATDNARWGGGGGGVQRACVVDVAWEGMPERQHPVEAVGPCAFVRPRKRLQAECSSCC